MGQAEDTVSPDTTSAAEYAADAARELIARQNGSRRRGDVMQASRTRQMASTPTIDVGILTDMAASSAELVEHVQASADISAPVPAAPTAVYTWYGSNSPLLDEKARQAADAIAYRHGLEYRIRALGAIVLRQEQCPSCGCFGLQWVPQLGRAVCHNLKYDSDPQGRPRTFTIRQIATAAVTNLPLRAAT